MKKVILILAGLFVLFVMLTALSVIYTERPEFCLSCHIMKPYYASWKASAHKETNCIKCHYEPSLKAHVMGKINGLVEVAQYLTKRYSNRPAAKVSDAACLRNGCHIKEKVAGTKVMFKNKVEFNHAKHFGQLRAGIKLRCTSCHNQMTNDEHITIDKNACFICHFKNVPPERLAGRCLICHKGIPESPTHKEYSADGVSCLECHSSAKKGDGSVHKQACYFCHDDKLAIEKVSDKELIHKAHIPGKNADCINCHDFIEHNG